MPGQSRSRTAQPRSAAAGGGPCLAPLCSGGDDDEPEEWAGRQRSQATYPGRSDVRTGDGPMSGAADTERRARLALSFLANPGDPVLGAALRTMSASEVLAATTGSDADGEARLAGGSPDSALARAIARWRARLADMPGTGRLTRSWTGGSDSRFQARPPIAGGEELRT